MDARVPRPGASARLLGADDPDVAEVLNVEGRGPLFLLVCHAGRAIPAVLGTLGVDEAARARHIGWDIGAADIARHLSDRLDAPAVLATYSRLVVDLNRVPGTFDSIPAESDGTIIPGNLGLRDEDRLARIDSLFWPYHNRVAEAFAGRWNGGRPTALVAVHTFTPCLNGGRPRPWEAGVMWNRDDRLAVPLIRFLRERGLSVGENAPYSGREGGFTMEYHAGDAGVPHVAVEIRQDLAAAPGAAVRWAALLDEALRHALGTVGPLKALAA